MAEYRGAMKRRLNDVVEKVINDKKTNEKNMAEKIVECFSLRTDFYDSIDWNFIRDVISTKLKDLDSIYKEKGKEKKLEDKIDEIWDKVEEIIEAKKFPYTTADSVVFSELQSLIKRYSKKINDKKIKIPKVSECIFDDVEDEIFLRELDIVSNDEEDCYKLLRAIQVARNDIERKEKGKKRQNCDSERLVLEQILYKARQIYGIHECFESVKERIKKETNCDIDGEQVPVRRRNAR